jgi:hypothetical protein
VTWPANTYSLKIDIDTRRGLEKGVPVLLDRIAAMGIKATFFMSWGPDNSGRALLKLFTDLRFLRKMLRTNAAGTYGLKTALYGWLLPAPMIGLGRPEIARAIVEHGHEVELHAWDHRTWQDTVRRREEAWIRDWLTKAVEAHERTLGSRPSCFGAPAWTLPESAQQVVKELGFGYSSSTRGNRPFLLEPCGLVELPGNVPCLEETGSYDPILQAARSAGGGVITLHAEVEGGKAADSFGSDLVRPLLEQGARFVLLSELAGMVSGESLERRAPAFELLAGRADECSV